MFLLLFHLSFFAVVWSVWLNRILGTGILQLCLTQHIVETWNVIALFLLP